MTTMKSPILKCRTNYDRGAYCLLGFLELFSTYLMQIRHMKLKTRQWNSKRIVRRLPISAETYRI